MTTGELVLPLDDPTASMACTTSMPLMTEPNTTCFPSNHDVCAVHRKNWGAANRRDGETYHTIAGAGGENEPFMR